MRNSTNIKYAFTGFILLICGNFVLAQDWPQWRGTNRDAKVTGFTAPQTWPKELTKKWNVTVGEGTDSTPALVGDKLYVFTRKEGNEAILCLNAATGVEIWSDKYEVPAISGADQGHSGPRSTPTVENGKIFTLGVTGILSCYDVETYKLLWRKNDFPGAFPRFHTAMSPVVVDNLCIGHFGNADNGAVVAYDITTGDQKWKWSGGTGYGPSYASPVVATIEGMKQVILQTERNVVSLAVSDGKLLWQIASYGGRYVASSPVADEKNSVIYGMGSNGIYALKITKEGDEFKTQPLWTDNEISLEYNTPVLRNDLLFGLTSNAKLVIFEPNDKEYKELASYQVSNGQTYAYPIVSGNRIFTSDQTSVTLWTIE